MDREECSVDIVKKTNNFFVSFVLDFELTDFIPS